MDQTLQKCLNTWVYNDTEKQKQAQNSQPSLVTSGTYWRSHLLFWKMLKRTRKAAGIFFLDYPIQTVSQRNQMLMRKSFSLWRYCNCKWRQNNRISSRLHPPVKKRIWTMIINSYSHNKNRQT
jgi:hypothetical protein